MSCMNDTKCTDEDEHFMLGTADSIEVLIYFLCFAVGGPLNVIALRRSLRAFRKHRAKSPILLLRINLNLADLCTLFVYVPKQIIWMLTYQWYGGEVLCRVCSFFSTFSFYANSFVITCIAIDRVCGAYNISSLNAHRRAYLRCRRLLVVGWAAAFTLSLPQAAIFRVFKPYSEKDFRLRHNCTVGHITSCIGFVAWYLPSTKIFELFACWFECCLRQCTPLWTTFLYEKIEELKDVNLTELERTEIQRSISDMQQLEKLYNINHLLFVFWIPCIIIVISYLTVLFILQGRLKEEYHSLPLMSAAEQLDEEPSKCKSKRKCPLDDSQTVNSALSPRSTNPGAIVVSTIHKAKQHAKRQATWIILAYLTFWSPYNVLAVLNMTRTLSDHHVFAITLSFLNAAICANPIANPLIYGVLKDDSKP